MSKIYSNHGLTEAQIRNRDLAMANLGAFIKLVSPGRVLGHCHFDMIKFLQEEHPNQLIIWPRGHQKSTMVAFWAAWYLINNPASTIILASSTADLAEKQLGFIKEYILNSPIVKQYWPELIHPEEGKRAKWSVDEVVVDHPLRAEKQVRDPSLKAAGIGKALVGFHCDVAIMDDIVTDDNSQTKTERDKVKRWASLLVSIVNPGGMVKAVGTRYHPDELYGEMMEMMESVYDIDGNVIDEQPIYVHSVEIVERDGNFLWPRQKGPDGVYYGFNRQVLSKIRGQYIDKSQFWAQYYNDPSDPQNKRIENFQYYDRDKLTYFQGRHCFNGKPLNVYAAIDFAASLSDRADYTAIVVVGIDQEHLIYVLDIDRFKTNKISEMAERLERLYGKWGWIRLRAEINAQQGLIVEQIRDYNRKRGVFYNISSVNQVLNKEIRILANLEPRYAEGVILHYRGGFCQVLEDELSSSKPPHDDVSDALASVIEITTAPSQNRGTKKTSTLKFHSKWGGVA